MQIFIVYIFVSKFWFYGAIVIVIIRVTITANKTSIKGVFVRSDICKEDAITEMTDPKRSG